MMTFIFLVIMVFGLSAFGVLFMKELKSGALDDKPLFNPANPDAANISLEERVHLRESTVQTVPGMERLEGANDALPGGIIGERCRKLELMLEEKNRLLTQSEQELFSERAHRGEFESLKDILLRQIEDLKAQNKRIKDDLSRALQGNADPTSGPKAAGAPADAVPVDLHSSEVPSEKFEQFFNSKDESGPALSLHDIFENKQKII